MLTVPAQPDRSLLAYLAEPGSPTMEALQVLMSWVTQQSNEQATRSQGT
jgi:hypothetical protein